MTTLIVIAVALLLAIAACTAWAQSQDAGPFDLALIGTYAWVVGIAMLGGAASFYRNVRAGRARPFNLTEFVGELFVSAFAGFITFLLCKWAAVNPYLTAAFVGIAGHMGSRAIIIGEQLLERWYGRIAGGSLAPQPEPELRRGTPGDER